MLDVAELLGYRAEGKEQRIEAFCQFYDQLAQATEFSKKGPPVFEEQNTGRFRFDSDIYEEQRYEEDNDNEDGAQDGRNPVAPPLTPSQLETLCRDLEETLSSSDFMPVRDLCRLCFEVSLELSLSLLNSLS